MIWNLIKSNKTFAVLLVTIVLIELAHGIEIVALLPLYLTRHFLEDGAFVGLVASTYLFVDAIIARTPAGWLADRWGRKPTLLTGIAFSFLPLPLMALVTDPHWFIPLNIVNGIGAGMIWPPIYALVADLYDSSRRGTVMGLVNMVMLGGLVAGGPIAGSLLLQLLGYPDPAAFPRGFVASMALVGLAFVLVAVFVCETSHGRATAKNRLLSQASPHGEGASASETLSSMPRAFFLLLAIGLCVALGLGLIVPILILFATNVLQVTLGTFALIMIPPALVAALALIPAGRWADRRGRHVPMLLGLILIAIPFWGASLSVVPFIVSAGGMVAALGYAFFVPSWNAQVMDYIPAERRGFFLGGVATVQGLGLAMGPFIGGQLFQQNPYAPFWGAGALMTLAAGGAAVLLSQHRAAREIVLIRESD